MNLDRGRFLGSARFLNSLRLATREGQDAQGHSNGDSPRNAVLCGWARFHSGKGQECRVLPALGIKRNENGTSQVTGPSRRADVLDRGHTGVRRWLGGMLSIILGNPPPVPSSISAACLVLDPCRKFFKHRWIQRFFEGRVFGRGPCCAPLEEVV